MFSFLALTLAGRACSQGGGRDIEVPLPVAGVAVNPHGTVDDVDLGDRSGIWRQSQDGPHAAILITHL